MLAALILPAFKVIFLWHHFRSASCCFRLLIKCRAPSSVSSSPDLSGTPAFWQSVFISSRCASVIIGSSIAHLSVCVTLQLQQVFWARPRPPRNKHRHHGLAADCPSPSS